ncbi:tRNA adenosine(34) deaminase TadA [Acidiferrobacter sp.]|jgi:tRNA(adenine34) deaminase|uniref:tRNA adenosine(34) deaminase TadA n=1 Tax=Acidiferrobacter sp. TaxID=1872107 RepID=UPI00262CAE9D|nr:tRNA adenosine(34) deaminase TadA [Acidiferrobacter sp.]
MIGDIKNAAAQDDEYWMAAALAEAANAGCAGEVPVGAVLVRAGVMLAGAGNSPIALHDPTAHAEILALRAGGARVGNYRLKDCVLYVTLEPCAMCAVALVHARVARLVFGAADPRAGAAGSVFTLTDEARFNHRVAVTGGVLATECQALLRDFFRARRADGGSDCGLA